MTYRRGDLVQLKGLPRPILCEVSEAEPLGAALAGEQILKLVPLEGPWPHGTFLIRLDNEVRRAPGGRSRMRLLVQALAAKRGEGGSGPASHEAA
jgi:hypothetical protein